MGKLTWYFIGVSILNSFTNVSDFYFHEQESYPGPAVEAISPSAPGKNLLNITSYRRFSLTSLKLLRRGLIW